MALDLDSLGLAALVTDKGITAPDYQTVLATLTDYFKRIYGADAYLEPDSKDGQMIALVALAIHDANATAIQVYNSFSPATALGDALSRNVKINGIQRRSATNSTVDLTLTGAPGTIITNGSAKDAVGNQWNLPDKVTIGANGSVIATATADEAGEVTAVPGAITQINTPTRGWASVTNATAANAGRNTETDAQLRRRQSNSVAIGSRSIFDGIIAGIADVDGVTNYRLYENYTGSEDGNGLPGHSIAAVVEGGDANNIAQTIFNKKAPGVYPYGDTEVSVNDAYGVGHTVGFFRPTYYQLNITITLTAFSGYSDTVAANIKQAVADYIGKLSIGDKVYISRLYSPAQLGVVSGGDARYYDVEEIAVSVDDSTVSQTGKLIDIPFNGMARCSVSDIDIVVEASR
ncbi:hypothetical protein R84981_002811 [Carnimonas sp. R-84981]|uniref:baseplate J/gp47 family protein n=1 Tax=Carnimonas bestiolae TaxID=3402172 RepID=UPI003EDC4C40